MARVSLSEQSKALEGNQDYWACQERYEADHKDAWMPLDLVSLVVNFQNGEHTSEADCCDRI